MGGGGGGGGAGKLWGDIGKLHENVTIMYQVLLLPSDAMRDEPLLCQDYS